MFRRYLLGQIMAFLMVMVMPFAAFGDDEVGRPSGGGSSIQWVVTVDGYERIELRVVDSCGEVHEKEFKVGTNPSFRLADLAEVVDGEYSYQLLVIPSISSDLAAKLKKLREAGDDAGARKLMCDFPNVVQTGAFTIVKGSIANPDAKEDDAGKSSSASNNSTTRGGGVDTNARPGEVVVNDQVIPDDLIVQGSACVGFDCINNESFSFDTIRLKENNLRIHFDDTSTAAGFPANDWRIIANDSASGGASKFSIEDSTGSKTPLTIRGGAATNSIFVDSTGRVGFRTGTPVLDVHINTSNTPGIRLEQNNSGGFTAQTWDIAGNEANFFIRDVTGGSRLPFRIRPGAPTSSVDISADGDVGIGTASPDYRLNVVATGATDNTVLQIENNGPTRMRFVNTSSGETWNVGHQSPSGTGLVFSDTGDGTTEMDLDTSGNMTIAGMLVQNSSRDTKTEFGNIDPVAALAGVRSMPILTWVYKHDQKAARHIGPMAEDFHAAFNLGFDAKHIAPSDQSGVALAAIQELANLVQQLSSRVAELEAEKLEAEKLEQK